MAEFIGRRNGKMTAEQRRKMHETQKWVDAHRDELDREALEHKPELDMRIDAFRRLKAAREARGLSLGEVAERSGIDKSRLSKLENDPYPNPTLSTLSRIARGIGVELSIEIRQPG